MKINIEGPTLEGLLYIYSIPYISSFEGQHKFCFSLGKTRLI